MDVVHDGWLLKSPPPKRLWRAKWRDRWFVLRAGELPGRFFLEYYTDSTCRKLKGKIDLDQCEQVRLILNSQIDAGITFAQRKFEYKFMFDIKTPKRVFYLCADTEESMNKWVEIVCQVCGLRVMSNEDFEPFSTQLSPTSPMTPQMMADNAFSNTRPLEADRLDSPPPSACSTMSGPYIPISECITGKKSQMSTRFPFNDDAHLSLVSGDSQHPSIPTVVAPRPPNSASALQALVRNARMKPKDSTERSSSITTSEDPSVQSPLAKESVYPVFQDFSPLTPLVKDTMDGNSHTSNRKKSINSINSAILVPPRPPKPAHLAEPSHQNYMNIDSSLLLNFRSSCSSDKSRTSSNNMSLSGQKTSISSSDAEASPLPTTVQGCARSCTLEGLDKTCELTTSKSIDSRLSCSSMSKIFSYDGIVYAGPDKNSDPRVSPAGIYSNILAVNKNSDGPPAVHRGLKPKKMSDSSPVDVSLEGAVGGIPVQPSSAPPTVHRSLKPLKKPVEPISISLTPKFTLAPVPRSRLHNPNQRKPRAAPSPTPPTGVHSDLDDTDCSSPVFKNESAFNERVFFPMNDVTRRSSNEIQYLDLDLDSNIAGASPINGLKAATLETSVVYKKVDFLKTEAFNKTRQSIEEDRKGQ